MHIIFKLLILLTFSLLLSACPDPGSDIRTYCRTDTADPNNLDANGDPVKIGNILHTYIPNEQIQYTASGVVNGTPVYGTLTVDWKVHAPLLKPIETGVSIPVLEEKTVLDVQGFKKTTFRYIVQDPTPIDPINTESTKGTYKVWSFGNGLTGTDEILYWTNEFANDISTTVSEITYFKSPFNEETLLASPISEAITHYPMVGCKPGVSCGAKAANYTESYTVNSITTDNKIVETISGTFFEAYKIKIDNAQVNYVGLESTNNLRLPLDFRHTCSTGPNGAPINFDGTMWVFPELGPVKYQINCSSGLDAYNLTFDFRTTNIPLPPSVSGDQNTACN